ncbi:MAG: rhomboid family intramembrane serine protease [Lacipirellulaceae bacterium]
MGFENRDYFREDQPGVQLSMPQTVTMRLVLLNVAIYFLQLIMQSGDTSVINQYFALRADWFSRPWQAYQLLTYGFLHSLGNVGHILLNMFMLWMFGSQVEQRYGPKSFLAFYLTAIVFAGLGWSLTELAYQGSPSGMLGASGGIAAMFILYALNWPHRQIMFMMIIPAPAWLVASLGILLDMQGAISRSGNVAFTAHLAGALFGYLFYRTGFNPLAKLLDGASAPKIRRGPKLRVHTPDDDEDEGDSEVDRILRKISEQGQDSLTRRERRTLEQASREMKGRR